MSEIEKLMQNAGVSCKPNYVYNKVPILSGIDYPPFTAEKQLELIKWLANNKCIEISKHFIDLKNNRKHWVSRDGLQFEESLAELVNLIWQSLSDIEKAEIKRILE